MDGQNVYAPVFFQYKHEAAMEALLKRANKAVN